MELQQKEGFSPFGGCLPMFLQLPIITFLYNVIRNPLSHICKLSVEEITQIRGIISAAGMTPAVDEIGLVANIQAILGILQAFVFAKIMPIPRRGA